MRILKYGIRIAIICIICLLIGKGLLWYVGYCHYYKVMSLRISLAKVLLDDEEYIAFLNELIKELGTDVTEIDAVLAVSNAALDEANTALQGTDKPISASETLPGGAIKAEVQKEIT